MGTRYNTYMKICKTCKVNKSKTEFYNRRGVCKSCDQARSKAWKAKNKDRKRETDASWYQKNKERVHNAGMTKYGITTEQYNAMLIAQNHSCKLCKKHESQFVRKLAVDHCHKTGKVRGLLCNYCNRGLGFFRDNTETLKAAILFLEEFK